MIHDEFLHPSNALVLCCLLCLVLSVIAPSNLKDVFGRLTNFGIWCRHLTEFQSCIYLLLLLNGCVAADRGQKLYFVQRICAHLHIAGERGITSLCGFP